MDVRMPDGTIIANVPPGTRQDELLRRYKAMQQQTAATQAAEDTPDWEAPFVAAGRVWDRLASGLRQATPAPIRSAIDTANTALGGTRLPPIDRETIDADTAAYAALEKKAPASTFAGELAATMAGASTPAGMAVLGATEYGTPGERAFRGTLGYAGGKFGEAIGSGITKLAGRESMAGVPRLADEFFETGGNRWNIPLTVGQRTQNRPAQIMESVVANVPGGSGVINKARDQTFSAFNRAVTNTFGEDAAKITPELLGKARSKIGAEIGDIAARNRINLDKELVTGLVNARNRAAAELTEDEAKIVNTQLQRIFNAVDTDTGTIPGKLYKAYQSALGKIAKNRGGTIADIFGDVRTSMREAMTRSVSEKDAAAWLKANERYFNVQQVAHATRTTPGELQPVRLLEQVNQAQKNAKFGGGNELAELAQWAKMKLPERIPNSGTAQRLLYQKIIESPLTALGAAGGLGYGADQLNLGTELASSVPVSYAVARALAGKPVSKSTEELLKRLGGGLLGVAALDYAR